MSPEQEERLVKAFEALDGVVGCLKSIARTMELDYDRRYPPKTPPKEPDITYIKTEEEQLREDQGDTGERSVSEWLTIGPREKAFLEREEKERRETSGVGGNHSGQTRD